MAGDFSVDCQLGEYVTSDKTLQNPCNKPPTQVSKQGLEKQNFESTPCPI